MCTRRLTWWNGARAAAMRSEISHWLKRQSTRSRASKLSTSNITQQPLLLLVQIVHLLCAFHLCVCRIFFSPSHTRTLRNLRTHKTPAKEGKEFHRVRLSLRKYNSSHCWASFVSASEMENFIFLLYQIDTIMKERRNKHEGRKFPSTFISLADCCRCLQFHFNSRIHNLSSLQRYESRDGTSS